MARFALLSLALMPLAVGCAGSVALEEVDGFGGVASAVWVHYDDTDTHQIVLSNAGGLCGHLQAAYDAYDDAQDAYLENLGDNDLCEEIEEPMRAYATEMNAIQFEGAHWLTFAVYDGADTEPDDDEYEVGKNPGVSGSMTYIENSPWKAMLDQFDPDSDDLDCGVDSDDVELDSDDWVLSDGELTIDVVNDEKSLHGSFDGELDEDDGDSAGDIRFGFTATWCEVG